MKTIPALFIALTILAGSCSGSQNNLPDPTNPSGAQKFRVDTLLSGLQNPWAVTFLPDGDMLITERPGRILRFNPGSGTATPLTGVPAVLAQNQGGMLDIVLHPNYAQNGWIYFTYSRPFGGGSNTALSRAKVNGAQLTDLELLFQAQPASGRVHHYGSRIAFDNDGYLYMSVGDRGEMHQAQQLNNHCGKVLRLRDDGTVPPDNPFVDSIGALPEIYSYGHRNIQGMARHPETGDIWTHEHGPKGGDEINIIKRGANYGWPLASFGINYDGSVLTTDTSLPGMEDPLYYWDPSIAPCGMAFYTGDKLPGWKGSLFIGALVLQHLNRTTLDGNNVTGEERLLQGMARFRDVRQGPDGHLYALTEGPGMLIRLVGE